jgi:hypothetical protein
VRQTDAHVLVLSLSYDVSDDVAGAAGGNKVPFIVPNMTTIYIRTLRNYFFFLALGERNLPRSFRLPRSSPPSSDPAFGAPGIGGGGGRSTPGAGGGLGGIGAVSACVPYVSNSRQQFNYIRTTPAREQYKNTT